MTKYKILRLLCRTPGAEDGSCDDGGCDTTDLFLLHQVIESCERRTAVSQPLWSGLLLQQMMGVLILQLCSLMSVHLPLQQVMGNEQFRVP
ncbi:hypothetical protein GDO81_023934 [Engystomops pustulosus]|uniref:Uncharacterized protein n=1 Tax=Engystomops pustulosus TaxID=76066 RepID=A0AAV6ZPN3_ENGPU|nr:hypothetical protein GDO81_023934 [Engystomops pustulosus]